MPLPQINCHKFFPPLFRQCHYHKSIASKFFSPILAMTLSQLVSFSGTPPSVHFGHFTGRRLHFMGKIRILVISLPKFNFFSLPITSLTFLLCHFFSYNFSNGVAEIQSFSLFFKINLNSTYNTNKLRFLQFINLNKICNIYFIRFYLLKKDFFFHHFTIMMLVYMAIYNSYMQQ